MIRLILPSARFGLLKDADMTRQTTRMFKQKT